MATTQYPRDPHPAIALFVKCVVAVTILMGLQSPAAGEQVVEIVTSEQLPAGSKITLTITPAKPPRIVSRGKPLIWFTAGDIDGKAFEQVVARDSRNVDAATRRARTSQFRYPLTVGQLGISRTAVLPRFADDGAMLAVRDASTVDNHVMWKPYVPGELVDGSFFVLDRTYRIVMRLRPVNFTDWPKANGFVIAYQAWGPGYPRNAKWRNPPVFLRWYKGEWQCGFKGGNPLVVESRSQRFSAEFTDEWSTFDITYKPSYTDGYFAVSKDEKLLGEVKGGATTVVYGRKVGPLSFFGAYSWNKQTPGVGYEFTDVLIEELSR